MTENVKPSLRERVVETRNLIRRYVADCERAADRYEVSSGARDLWNTGAAAAYRLAGSWLDAILTDTEGERPHPDNCEGCAEGVFDHPHPEQAELTRLRARVEELERLIRPGDTLQSAASRLAEWVRENDPPYEVRMAAIEAQRAVEEWTDARTDQLKERLELQRQFGAGIAILRANQEDTPDDR